MNEVIGVLCFIIVHAGNASLGWKTHVAPPNESILLYVIKLSYIQVYIYIYFIYIYIGINLLRLLSTRSIGHGSIET